MRYRSGCLFALLVGFVLAAPLLGQQVDVTTPKGALMGFYRALEAGDAAAVRTSFHAANEAERQLADAYAAQLTAAKALGDAAKAKFVTSGDALSKGLPVRDEIARVDAAEVAVKDDRATVKLAGQAKPLTLVKFDGRWRIAVADYAGATAETLATQTTVLNEMAAAFGSVTADITADKFPSAQEAQRALQKKLQTVLFDSLRKNPPTTATSTTQPKP